jgi:hypothetical protein
VLEAAGADVALLEPAGLDIAVLYPDVLGGAALDVIGELEFDAIEAEMSSLPLSGRARDEEPTCTVLAYDEMYLGNVRCDQSIRRADGLTSSASSEFQFETSLRVRPTVNVALAPGAMVIRSKPRRAFGALLGPPRLT